MAHGVTAEGNSTVDLAERRHKRSRTWSLMLLPVTGHFITCVDGQETSVSRRMGRGEVPSHLRWEAERKNHHDTGLAPW